MGWVPTLLFFVKKWGDKDARNSAFQYDDADDGDDDSWWCTHEDMMSSPCHAVGSFPRTDFVCSTRVSPIDSWEVSQLVPAWQLATGPGLVYYGLFWIEIWHSCDYMACPLPSREGGNIPQGRVGSQAPIRVKVLGEMIWLYINAPWMILSIVKLYSEFLATCPTETTA